MLATETLIGHRYRVGGVIGRGGGADVYQAVDIETAEPVAVKVLRSVIPDIVRRFEREQLTLSKLHHPAIVRMRDSGDHNGLPYLVFDLVDGEPLSGVLQRGPLFEDEVMRIGVALAGALAYAHSHGVVHRDVKPANVLIDRGGDAHLADFGVARVGDAAGITATGFVIGTAAYMAPEQVRGTGVAPASDVYALGLVLLEALTGQRAFEGSPSEAALARLHRDPHVPPTTSRSLSALLAAMTAADARHRPDALAVADALTTVAPRPTGDATAILPIATDATAAIALAPAPVPLFSPIGIRHPERDRRLAAVVAIAFIAALFALGAVWGRSGLNAPATETPSTATTVPAASGPSTTASTPAQATTGPARGKSKPKGNGDHGGG